MKEKDEFENWLKAKLEEETQEIYFSDQAKERARRQSKQSRHWWNGEVSLPPRVASFCLIALFILGVFYTGTFFYVSPQQIAKFEMKEKIVLRDDGVPFGALQHLVASLDNGKGVGRP